MLDLPNLPVIDKAALFDGCVRLPLRVDAERLAQEVADLPADSWGSRGGRVGVHLPAEAIFLRGFAPAEGDKPIVDRPALSLLPYARTIIETLIPAPALRCLLAKLPAGGRIAPHIDNAPYFSKSLRVHVPVTTHENSWMLCADRAFRMQVGEVWVINNSAVHGVWNADAHRSRIHMICDFTPTGELLALIARGDRNLAQSPPVELFAWQ